MNVNEKSIFQSMYDMLSEISVRGHKDIKRMDAVMDTLRQFIEATNKEGSADENHDERREDV